MAGYREHISVSGALGIVYGLVGTFCLGFTGVQGALAASLVWVSGMLPDLDSQTGKPVREAFSLIAAVTLMMVMQRLWEWGGDAETAMLLAIGLYAAIRYGGAFVLGKLAVHRGMFHSVPMLLIVTELMFLGYKSDSVNVRLLMAVGVAVGFASHLALDEMYSVAWTGLRLKLNQAAGSALKFVGNGFMPNLVTYGLLSALTYLILVDAGLLHAPPAQHFPAFFRQAVEEGGVLR